MYSEVDGARSSEEKQHLNYESSSGMVVED